MINELALKSIIRINHFFTKNSYNKEFVKCADKIEETDDKFIITVKTFGMTLVSKYKKSILTKEQIEFIKSNHTKKTSGVIL